MLFSLFVYFVVYFLCIIHFFIIKEQTCALFEIKFERRRVIRKVIRKGYSIGSRPIIPAVRSSRFKSSANSELTKDLKLESNTDRTRPSRLPRGYTTCIMVSVYIPEWNQPSKQNALINQLIYAIEPAIADSCTNGKPLILIGGDFNGADVSPKPAQTNQ